MEKATATPVARWIDDQQDRDLVTDTRKAYASITSAADRKAGSTGVLMRIAKTYLKWDDQPRNSKRARNALKQLTGVPLTSENCTEFFDSSLRLALIECINESASADVSQINSEVDGNDDAYMENLYQKHDGDSKKIQAERKRANSTNYEQNSRVRAAFLAAARNTLFHC